ncbi:MAG: hypothetical protein V3W09_04890, partial [Nitrososphaerales archaeon]
YKKPATRVLDGGVRMVETKVVGEDGKSSFKQEQSENDKRYQELIAKSDIDQKAKEWHKLGRLFNTVLIQTMYVRDEESTPPQFEPHFEFLVHTPAWTVVETSKADFLRPIAFYYPVYAEIKGKEQQVLVYWSVTEHYFIDRLGEKHPIGNNKEMTNPYNRLPISVLRFKSGMDFWGDGMWDLVDGNEEVSVQFANLAFTGLFQAHGQPVAINMNLSGEYELGPDRPIKAENAQKGPGQQDSSFHFESADAPITEIREMIDWMAAILQATKGLSPDEFVVQSKIQSGVAKIMDSAGIQETREDEQQVLENTEHDIFNTMRVIQNIEEPSKKIADDAEFSIHFAEPKVIKTTDEKIKEREGGIKLGYMSRVDIILEDNPEMTRDGAMKRLRQIIREEQQFKDEFGLLTEELGVPSNGTPKPGQTIPDL